MTARRDTVRVFIALDLPPAAKDALATTVEQLQAVIPSGIRWVNPAGIHLTLKFLGDIDAALVPPLLAAIRQSAGGFDDSSFPLRLAGLGVFPNNREPRVLWAGVDGALAALGRLQQSVDEAIAAPGLGFDKERRPFRPHLTLGRVRDGVPTTASQKIGAAITEAPPVTACSWPAEEIHLIRSTLTPQGAIYTSLGSAPLAGKE